MMKLFFFVVFVSFVAAIFAYISHIVDDRFEERQSIYSLIDKTKAIPDGTPNNLFWFVQVSDIHISRYRDLNRGPDLVKFCEEQLSVIQPEFILASGDLTDAKHKDLRGSEQYHDEWQTYQEVVSRCKKIVNVWLDLRGNHDAFNIPDSNDKKNLFRRYSSQGFENPSSYAYHHKKSFGRYSFIGVDATPNPGPRRPFNFFGYIKRDGEKELYRIVNESRGSNVTIAFGHYPSSLIALQTGTNIKTILRNVTAYLCGHLHTLAGLVPRMYAKHGTGMLELELGDWKEERIYRILAIDHDMLSIADVRSGHWPVVMVTNPKDASLISPQHEPLDRTLNSTHIRILVFSKEPVNNVEVHIDGVHVGKASHASGPLYVLPWKPVNFRTGLHTIKVTVKMLQGAAYDGHIHEQVFSLDGSSPLLPLRARLLLKLDLCTVAQLMFYMSVLVYVCVMILLRTTNNIKPHYIRSKAFLLSAIGQWYNRWLFRLWILSRVNKIYYTLQMFVIYVAFGPWFVAELIDGHLGVVFVWGMYVKGTFLPTLIPYIYGVFQVAIFNIPLTFYLAYLLQYSHLSPLRRSRWHAARHIHFPFLCLIALQMYIAVIEFPAAYGTAAFIVGPVRTGSVILALVMLYIARKTDISLLIANHNN